MIHVIVYHNVDSRFMPYEDGHRLNVATSHWLPGTDPHTVADWAWHAFNADLDMLEPDRASGTDGETTFLAAVVYRLLGHRSLSFPRDRLCCPWSCCSRTRRVLHQLQADWSATLRFVSDGPSGVQEWSLYWTTRGRRVPSTLVPTLGHWVDIDDREDQADIDPRTPILIDPQSCIDPVLARFFNRSRFAALAEGTREAYAKDYRVFFTFLWNRGRNWHEADPDDLLDWEAWRRRDRSHGATISGSKWQRELAALRLLYEWAQARGHIDRSPVLVHTVRLRDGTAVAVADQSPRDVRSSNVKWLTPRTYRLWRDVGLLGYDADQKPDEAWRGRNDARNAAFADLMFSSGLRLREGGCLLTLEVPGAVAGHGYYEGTVAAAVAKRRERMFYVSAAALARVAAYAATTRRLAIRAAQRHGRYERMPGRLIVTKVSLGTTRRLTWRDERGRTDTVPINVIGPSERMRLLIEGDHGGLEPLWLWLTEGGTPMAYPSWEKVFDAADARVATVFAQADGRGGRRRTPISCNPHMLRHSMALYMLVALHHALDRRFGLTPEERNHFRHVYGDPWMMVRDLLGHRSEQTTRLIYLEPLNGLQLRSMLDHDEDLETLLSRVAASSRLVMDVEPGEEL